MTDQSLYMDRGGARNLAGEAGPQFVSADRDGRTEELLRLILALSTNFIVLPADEMDDGIRDVLGAVGNFASADRCYVFQFSEAGKKVRNTHKWRAHGVASHVNGLRDLTEDDLPWLFERIRGLGIINVPDTSLLPSKARAEKTVALGEDACSLIVAPMVYGNSLLGFVGLDSVTRKRAWNDEIISLLKIVGELFANAFSRQKAAEAVRASERKYRNIVENATEGIFQCTPTGRPLSVNPAMAKMYGYDSAEDMMEKVTVMGDQLYVNPEEREKFEALVEMNGRVEGFEAEQRRKDGSTFRISINARVVRDENGTVLYYEGTREDVTARRIMEEMLHRERETFKEILEKAPYGVVLADSQGVYLYVNPEYTAITGYTLEDALSHRDWLKKSYPDPSERKEVRDFLRRDPSRRYADRVFSIVCRDGSTKEIEFRKVLLDDGRTIITLSDNTGKKHAVEALRESEEKFRTLFEDSKDAIYIASTDGRFEDCNRSFLSLFGYTLEEALRINAKNTYYDKGERQTLIETIMQKGAARDFEVKLLKKDGAIMDCLLTVSEKKGADGAVLGYQGIVRDITALKKTEETIRHMAYHDALTGLPNRVLFGDRLSVAMAKAQRKGEKVAVALLDMDKFKRVNDLMGHKAGDFVLKASANRILSVLRKSDTVARMGGDEFMLILDEVAGIDDVQAVVEKIVQAFRKSFVIDSNHFFITVSVGGAIYPDDGENADILIRRADIAMYHAKRNGRNHYCRYLPEMGSP
jgi:diguanylate cyclase (GGDEF)-like protein/PAS domain S-box-containing protein